MSPNVNVLPGKASISILSSGVLTVRVLLESSLTIPEYQRPYKWTTRHISQLLADIALHKDKQKYRLGTVVFHRSVDEKNSEKVNRNIVDGQQRILSLMLVIHALMNERVGDKPNPISRQDLLDALKSLKEKMNDPEFSNSISRSNLHNNYLAVSRIVSRAEFTEDLVDFLLNKCELVFFELNDIAEAFQFFDSQNARGKDLEPHDLLKAYHLREFTEEDEHLKAEAVSHWESCDTQQLTKLFANYLFRIRNWSRGESARYFGKEHIHLFKGVNINRIDRYPYVEQLRMAHHFVDDYNQHYQRRVDRNRLAFPFHLDQIIINGQRFFEMISHYHQEVVKFHHLFNPGRDDAPGTTRLLICAPSGFASDILKALDTYESKNRRGDLYVRSMFDCLLIAYLDKFGETELSSAVEKTFIWAYSLRLKMTAVQLASMDNYVLENNMFVLIKEATQPADFFAVELPVLQEGNVKASKMGQITKIYKEMRYCE